MNIQLPKVGTNSKSPINIEKIKELGVKNMRIVNPSIISGSSLETATIDEFAKIKASGIDTIIDFRADNNPILLIKCKKTGLNYINFPLDNVLTLDNPTYFSLSADNKRQVSNDFIKNLKQYFQAMNSQNLYVGCKYGIDRTNVGLLLNYLLNTKATHNAPEVLTWPGDRKKSVINKLIKSIKKILKALTPEQKEILGLEKNDNTYTDNQIKKLLKKNNSKFDITM